MTVPRGGENSRVRSSVSFAVSACIHSWVLAWVILSGAAMPVERPRSIYDQEIRPNEKRIVWYSLRDRLPEISPSDTSLDSRPPRAREKAQQTMVAGKRDDAQPAQLIWTPAPEIPAARAVPLPNVIAAAPPPKLVRPFVPPALDAPPAIAPPVLPDAPRVSAAAAVPALPITGGGAKPQPRAFTPPPEARTQRATALPMPDA